MANTEKYPEVNASLGRDEWPTWLLVVVVYSSWWGLLEIYGSAHPMLAGPLLVVIIALHTSVQHELLHGHPTRFDWLNGLLAYPPLALIFPYPVYRASHIEHHNNQVLTLPGIDPESYYVSPSSWDISGPIRRFYHDRYMTVLGRLLLGPATSIIKLIPAMAQDLIVGGFVQKLTWVTHLILIAALLTFDT